MCVCCFVIKQKTASEMRISGWSSDVCSSDLACARTGPLLRRPRPRQPAGIHAALRPARRPVLPRRQVPHHHRRDQVEHRGFPLRPEVARLSRLLRPLLLRGAAELPAGADPAPAGTDGRRRLRSDGRSEEHTSELQSLMRISYAVFCLKKKKNKNRQKISQK